MDFSGIDSLISEMTYEPSVEIPDARIKARLRVDAMNYREFLNVGIAFHFRGKKKTVNVKLSDERISKFLLTQFLSDRSGMTSSIRKKKLHAIIGQARQQAQQHLESISSGPVIASIRARLLAKDSTLDQTALLRPCRSLVDAVRNLHEVLESNTVIRTMRPEAEETLFTFLAAHYTEEEIVTHWKVCKIKSVVNS